MRGAQLRSFEQFVETHFRGILLFALAVVVVTVTVIVLLEMILGMSVIIDIAIIVIAIAITIAIAIIVVVRLGYVQHRTRCLHVVAELVLILVRMAALLRLH